MLDTYQFSSMSLDSSAVAATDELSSERQAFDRHVANYADLENQITSLSDQLKTLKKTQQNHSSNIVSFMQTHNVTKCNCDDFRLSVCDTVGQQSLSIPLLKTVFVRFFAKRPEMTDRLIDAIQQHRKESAGTRTRLKKVKKRTIE